MTGFNRRSFMILASGLLLPYEPERVYSFINRRRIDRIVWVEFLPAPIWDGVGFPPLKWEGHFDDTALVGDTFPLGRVVRIDYVENFDDGTFETRSHA